jgi:hypothetical protein
MSFFLVDMPGVLISLPVLFSKHQASGKLRVKGAFWVRQHRRSGIDLVVQLDCVCCFQYRDLGYAAYSFNRTLSKIKNLVRKPMPRCTFLRRIAYRCTEYFSAHHVARSIEKPWFTLFRGMWPSSRKGYRRKAASLSTPTIQRIVHSSRRTIISLKENLPLAALWFQITLYEKIIAHIKSSEFRVQMKHRRLNWRERTLRSIHLRYNLQGWHPITMWRGVTIKCHDSKVSVSNRF